MTNTGQSAPLTSMAGSLSREVQTWETKRDDAETKQKHRGVVGMTYFPQKQMCTYIWVLCSVLFLVSIDLSLKIYKQCHTFLKKINVESTLCILEFKVYFTYACMYVSDYDEKSSFDILKCLYMAAYHLSPLFWIEILARNAPCVSKRLKKSKSSANCWTLISTANP